MKRTGLWHALQALLKPSAVLADWQLSVGDDFAWVERYLVSTGKLATDHPCLSSVDCGCRHVFEQTPDQELQAVCCCGLGECPPVRVPLAGAFLYQLDGERFGAAVARALRLSDVNGRAGLYAGPHVRLVGTYGARDAPVYLAVGVRESELVGSLGNVASRHGEPFVLLAPTAQTRTEKVAEFLKAQGSAFIPLARCLETNGNGELQQTAAIEGVLASFREGPGKRAADGMVTIGRFRHSPGFEDVWLGDEHYDVRSRKQARLCLQYLVAQRAFDPRSARHLVEEIDPYVREHGNFLPAADVKIHDYFNDRRKGLPKLRRELIHPADRNGRFYLKTD